MNASDVRILKTIGVVADAAKSMQLELNIVSIDGGEIFMVPNTNFQKNKGSSACCFQLHDKR